MKAKTIEKKSIDTFKGLCETETNAGVYNMFRREITLVSCYVVHRISVENQILMTEVSRRTLDTYFSDNKN